MQNTKETTEIKDFCCKNTKERFRNQEFYLHDTKENPHELIGFVCKTQLMISGNWVILFAEHKGGFPKMRSSVGETQREITQNLEILL